jgi:hypothetical protein
MSWTNGDDYSEIEIRRNGSIIAILGGSATSYVDGAPPAGMNTYEVEPSCSSGEGGATESCVVHVDGSPIFIRGDANSDGFFNIADPVFILDNLFSGGPIPSCEEAADINDDGVRNIADAIYSLDNLFGNGSPPAAPFPECGVDTNPPGLSCTSSGCP